MMVATRKSHSGSSNCASGNCGGNAMRVMVRDLPDHVGKTVTLCGWVNALRRQRTMQFVILRDSSGKVQITHRRGGEGDRLEQIIDGLTDESAVRVTGTVPARAGLRRRCPSTATPGQNP